MFIILFGYLFIFSQKSSFGIGIKVGTGFGSFSSRSTYFGENKLIKKNEDFNNLFKVRGENVQGSKKLNQKMHFNENRIQIEIFKNSFFSSGFIIGKSKSLFSDVLRLTKKDSQEESSNFLCLIRDFIVRLSFYVGLRIQDFLNINLSIGAIFFNLLFEHEYQKGAENIKIKQFAQASAEDVWWLVYNFCCFLTVGLKITSKITLWFEFGGTRNVKTYNFDNLYKKDCKDILNEYFVWETGWQAGISGNIININNSVSTFEANWLKKVNSI